MRRLRADFVNSKSSNPEVNATSYTHKKDMQTDYKCKQKCYRIQASY